MRSSVYGSHNIKRIEYAEVPLAWFLYGEGKLRIDHVAVNGQNMIADDHWPSRQIIRKRDNKKTRIGTVAMAGQRDLRSVRQRDPHLRECWFDRLVEP